VRNRATKVGRPQEQVRENAECRTVPIANSISFGKNIHAT
jgi:hypothetical protein